MAVIKYIIIYPYYPFDNQQKFEKTLYDYIKLGKLNILMIIGYTKVESKRMFFQFKTFWKQKVLKGKNNDYSIMINKAPINNKLEINIPK